MEGYPPAVVAHFLGPKGENSMSVPAAFDYHPATSVDEAIALLQQYGDDAKLLAGGHSLIPTMKLRLAQPGHFEKTKRQKGRKSVLQAQDARKPATHVRAEPTPQRR